MINKEEYIEFAENGFNIVPLIKTIEKDLDSPIKVFSRIKNIKNTFLLESIEGGEKWAQYSIIGVDCQDSIKVSDNKIEIKTALGTNLIECKDPLNELNKLIAEYKTPILDGMPRFYGGYVGFFAYESAKYAENKINALQRKDSKFDVHMPDIYLVKSEKIIIYDNFNNSIQAVYNANPQKTSYEDALEIIEEIQNSIDHSGKLEETSYSNTTGQLEFKSNFTKNEYMSSVNKIKEYIKEGDVMQVVLAQDFYQSFDGDSFKLYSALRQINPSPYMYYLNLDECEVVGSSPEILVRLEDSNITLRPIAGTRKRGANEEEDKNNEKDLLNDPKELAEHLMLIDLGRNDVGKVSKIGSVNLIKKMEIEFYSHVMHIVSEVEGEKNNDLDFFDIFFSGFPAGTVTGAPKIRAMELINELEPCRRGFYSGGIGLIDYSKDFDSCIAIRSMQIHKSKATFQAGAGIVYDSIPENEYQECINKLIVLERALTIAEQGKKSP